MGANKSATNKLKRKNAFDEVIGYDDIKLELEQICDMVKKPDKYTKLGASLPAGVILHGHPGLGKSLMANCFVKQADVPTFILRRDKGDASFIDVIKDTFEKAKNTNGVSIVFLDDMDKFANEDEVHPDAPEYVTIQSCIDDCKGFNVFVIATVNNLDKLPDSLVRNGRFDKCIHFSFPIPEDCRKIVEYYLSSKSVSQDLNYDDIAKMIGSNSCAYLESVINEAAILSAFNGDDCITMDSVVSTILNKKYGIRSIDLNKIDDDFKSTSIHEAGHALVLDVLVPGSVGIVAVKDQYNGFTRRCKDLQRRTYDILVSIAGKVATELYYGGICASGCQRDLDEFSDKITRAVVQSGSRGVNNIEPAFLDPSQNYLERVESIVSAEMERYIYLCRDIIIKNKSYLEKISDRLIKKGYILNSELSEIRNTCEIIDVAV